MRRREKNNFSPHIRIDVFVVGYICLICGLFVEMMESPQKEGSKAVLVLLPLCFTYCYDKSVLRQSIDS